VYLNKARRWKILGNHCGEVTGVGLLVVIASGLTDRYNVFLRKLLPPYSRLSVLSIC
jgi:hypothetical protein